MKIQLVYFSVSKDGSSCAQISRKNSVDKGDKTKVIKPEEDNETVFANSVPKFKISVPAPMFNASQPNFYTELNSTSSDNITRSSSISKPVTNFACTANIDEDYDT